MIVREEEFTDEKRKVRHSEVWLLKGGTCPWPCLQSSFHMLCSHADDSLKLEESWLFFFSVFFQILLQAARLGFLKRASKLERLSLLSCMCDWVSSQCPERRSGWESWFVSFTSQSFLSSAEEQDPNKCP